jgi:phosphoserine phosphatase
MENSIFYSDSHNDIPLLELVDTAVAVDPDDKLAAVAKEKGWKILSLR